MHLVVIPLLPACPQFISKRPTRPGYYLSTLNIVSLLFFKLYNRGNSSKSSSWKYVKNWWKIRNILIVYVETIFPRLAEIVYRGHRFNCSECRILFFKGWLNLSVWIFCPCFRPYLQLVSTRVLKIRIK